MKYWEDKRNGADEDIYMYDLSNGQETQITSNSNPQISPDIYGNIIVWSELAQIHMYDLSTGQDTRITEGATGRNARIHGDKIVWQDWRNGAEDIYLYDISTGQETRITSDPSYQLSASIFENKIVWSDSRNGKSDIYMTTIS